MIEETNWVEIAGIFSKTQADLLRAFLEGHGITVNMLNDNILSVHAWLSPAVGGCIIQVKEDQLEDAQALLKDYQDHL